MRTPHDLGIELRTRNFHLRQYENESTAQDSQTQHISVGSRGTP